ncbi:hypothetical protein CEP45_02070 [Mergibacter septicus]|uniref:lysine exporter LysO family protein n=1 Tax=Mergibacter septicus TaxID=221402 RepID=UPI001C78E1C6|nr:lysine exporter LysO family protein [Mergibacter septicus]QDJ12700.1 hypothetical protein CEP45_02070 [Mergibacter septicus]
MLESLMIVLLPLFLGYTIKIRRLDWVKKINQGITSLMFFILFLIGISLGQLDDFLQQLPVIGFTACLFASAILICNLIVLFFYDRAFPHTVVVRKIEIPSRAALFIESLKFPLVIFIGFICGVITKTWLILPHALSTYVLVLLVFLVGIQLRNNGITLRQVFFHRRGIIIALLVTVSSLIGGIIAALFTDMPIVQGLALASGMGWYSLSSVLINDAWGAVFGSIAFFNDLLREMASFLLIPLLIHRFRSIGVGISGAAALDCTLPIIQRSGGIEVVPLAISFGFVLNLIVPIFLVLFTSIPIN